MGKIKRSLAIVIGINEYSHIPQLNNAVSDAQELALVLEEKYGYKVLPLLNEEASKEKLDDLLKNLENKTIQFDSENIQVDESDRLLFYFAGHGFAEEAHESEEGKPVGYFMPQNAENGNRDSWFSMQEVYQALSNLNCHHLLMILDCCFAGRISWVAQGRNAAHPRKLYQQSYDRFIKHRTEQIITSAAHDEKAQDSYRFGRRGEKNGHSPFAHLLLKVLKGNPDGRTDKFIEAILEDKVITVHELFTYLQNQLEEVAEGQTPALSQPRKYDSKTGEYVFLKGEYIFPLPSFKPQNLIPLKLDENTNPYKSLASFEQEDSQLFFGRKKLIEEPKEGLSHKVINHQLTVVLGLSGSGKSSLVKAGLIPILQSKQEANQEQWYVINPMRPGEYPLTALAKTIQPLTSIAFDDLVKKLKQNSQFLTTIFQQWSQNNPHHKLLLTIDQSEELITLSQNEQEREQFLQLLQGALAVPELSKTLRIVLILRSEFEPQIRDLNQDKYKETDWQKTWQKLWQNGRFFVTPMDRQELQQVIEEPAAQRALFFESPKLVNDLIDEVVQMPGALPLLSFTLSELYLKYLKAEENGDRNDRTITEADYQDIGGVTRSLTETADKTYRELLEKEKVDSSTIRDVIMRMVAISSGELARRRVPTSELVYPEPKNEQAKKVIEHFIKARLLVKEVIKLEDKNQEYVEPVHDALITGWKKIKDWLEEKQETFEKVSRWNQIKKWLNVNLEKVPLPLGSKKNGGKRKGDHSEAENPLKINLALQREVTTAAFKYEEIRKKQPKKAFNWLWDEDPRLPITEQIYRSADNWLNEVEYNFVQLSVNKQRQNKIIRWTFAGLVLVVTTIFSFAVWTQWRNSELNRADSLGRLSLSLFDEGKELDAIIKSIRAGKILQKYQATNPEVMRALITNIYQGSERNRFQGHNDYVNSVSVSNDGKTLVSGSDDQTIKVWNLETGEIIHTLTTDNYNDPIYSVIVNPNGQNLVGGSYSGTIKVWNLETGEVIHTLTGSNHSIWSVSVSKDGQTMVSGSGDGSIKVWNLETGKPIRTLTGHKQSVFSVSVSPDGQTLVSGSMDQTIKVWNLKTGKLIRTLTGHSRSVHSVIISPDGQTLISGSEDKTIKVWNLEMGGESRTLTGHDNRVNSVSLSPDGQTLVSGSTDKTIKVWNLETGKLIHTLSGDRSVYSVNACPDGKTFVSSGLDSIIKVWNHYSYIPL